MDETTNAGLVLRCEEEESDRRTELSNAQRRQRNVVMVRWDEGNVGNDGSKER